MSDLQNRIIQKMTPGQKIAASMMLYYSARDCKAAWLRKLHPDWSEQQIQRAVREAFSNARS